MTQKVVFLPGMMCDDRLFGPQIGDLSDQYDCDVITFSTEPSISDMSKTVIAKQSAPFHVVGLSMGGIVALDLALHHADKITSLTVINSTARADHPNNSALRKRQIKAVQSGLLSTVMKTELKPNYVYNSGINDETLSLCLNMAMSLGPNAFVAQSLALMHRADYVERIKDVTCPTLIISGENDTLCPLDRHLEIAERLPHAKLTVIPNCGHLSSLEHPDVVTAALLDFLLSQKEKLCPA